MGRLSLLTATFALFLGACAEGENSAPATNMVSCALAGAASFAQDCTMERAEADGERFVVLRHPDGGFRRFQLGVPGSGLITADGMEEAEITQLDGQVEVRVGADRYRLPIAD